jgi:hypothetical protein
MGPKTPRLVSSKPLFAPAPQSLVSLSPQDKKKVIEFLGKSRNGDPAFPTTDLDGRFTSPTSPALPSLPLPLPPYSTPPAHFLFPAPPQSHTGPAFTINHIPFDPMADYDTIISYFNPNLPSTPLPAPLTPSNSISNIVERAWCCLDPQPDTTLMTALPLPLPSSPSPNVHQWADSAYITSQGPFPEPSFYPTGDTCSNLTSEVAQYLNIAQYESPSRLINNDTPKEWVNSLQQIQYYFHRVRKMQYCFAGSTTTDIMRDMVVRTILTPH